LVLMATPKTSAAIYALEQLSDVGFINGMIRGRVFDPLPEGAAHHPNWSFFRSTEWYLTCREIAHAADILNAYCQALLAEALEHTPDLWDKVKKRFKNEGTRENVIAKLRMQRGSDGAIRQIWEKDLGTFWNAEMDLIALLRNRIVHQGGFDRNGEIPRAIERCREGRKLLPPINQMNGEIPVSIDEHGKLIIDAKTGKWATDHVHHNIYMMDHICMGQFNIPGRRYVMKRQSFRWQGGSRGIRLLPGEPLPTGGPEAVELEFPTLPIFPEYNDMNDPSEIECAQIWKKAMAEIHGFVEEYCDEVGAGVRSFFPGMPGKIHSNTIRHHEHHLGYRVAYEAGEGRGGFLGIRLRQKDFKPYLTVWSDETMMQDFDLCELSEGVKEAIREGIDRVMVK